MSGRNAKSRNIASIYRPTNSKVEVFDNIETLIRNVDKECKKFVTLGDLNCDILSNNKNNRTKRLLDVADLFQFKQLITEPTGATESTDSLTDLFFTNKEKRILSSGVIHVGI